MIFSIDKVSFYKKIGTVILLTCYPASILFSQIITKETTLDVLNYELKLEVDIENESIQGKVNIEFLINPDESKVVFDSGNLKILEVVGKNVVSFLQKTKKVIIYLNNRNDNHNLIQITYSGRPSHGLVFLPNSKEVYTVFSTSQWMICNDSPGDRAKFKIELSVPSDKQCVASGILTHKANLNDRFQYSWVQDF